MGKKWVVAIVVIVLVLGLVGFYLYASWVLEESFVEDSMYYCEIVDDCLVDNADCSHCSCDESFGVNRDYFGKVCEGVNTEIQCNMDCELPPLECIDNRCVLVGYNNPYKL